MQYKKTFIIAGIVGCFASSSAFAVSSEQGSTVHHKAQRHNVARMHNPKTMSDVPQESAAPDVKPQAEPEYFGHASGSDGSMPQ